MLTPIKKPFYLLRNGSMILFDATTLLKYITTSGDMRDPVTRQTLASHEMMRLTRVCNETTLSEERLFKVHRGEVGRRELLSFLEDELISEAHGPSNGMPMIFEIFSNIRAIATEEELHVALRHFHRNGITISRTTDSPPRSPEPDRSLSSRSVPSFSSSTRPTQVPSNASRHLAPTSSLAPRIWRAPVPPTPPPVLQARLPMPPQLQGNLRPSRVIMLSELLPPVLDLPTPPPYMLQRIRQLREERQQRVGASNP